MISESQDFFCKLTPPPPTRVLCCFFFGAPYFACAQYGLACRPISLALNTGSLSPYFACAQYGLLAAIARWAIRRLPGVALRYTPGCVLAPLQGARCSNDRKPGVALRYTPGCILAPFQGALFPHRQICHICRRQMSIHLAIFVTSAVGRCPFPLAIYGEGVADRPGVRSTRPKPLARFI